MRADESFPLDSPTLEVECGLLSNTWNVLNAVHVIDKFCEKRSIVYSNCLTCPLRRETDSGEYVCQVNHKKWKGTRHQNDGTHYINWDERKTYLNTYDWWHGNLGNNFFYYKKKQCIRVEALKKMNDKDFLFTVTGDSNEYERFLESRSS